MMQTEFETLTGIYPDITLYDAIEREYTRKNDDDRNVWQDKQTFCEAYKADTDGLAQKIQRLANDKIWREHERNCNAVTVSAKREQEMFRKYQAAQNRIKELEANLYDSEIERYCNIAQEYADIKSEPKSSNELKEHMFDAIMQAANDENSAETILHMVFGFEYLLDRMEGEQDA